MFGKQDAADFPVAECTLAAPASLTTAASIDNGPSKSNCAVFEKPGAQFRSRSLPPVLSLWTARFSPALVPRDPGDTNAGLSDLYGIEPLDGLEPLEPSDSIEPLDLDGGRSEAGSNTTVDRAELVRSIQNMDAAAVSDIVLGSIDSFAESLLMPLGFSRGISLSSGYCGPPASYTAVESNNGAEFPKNDMADSPDVELGASGGEASSSSMGFCPLRIPSDVAESSSENHEARGIDYRSSQVNEPSSGGSLRSPPRSVSDIRESGEEYFDDRLSTMNGAFAQSPGSPRSPQFLRDVLAADVDVQSQSASIAATAVPQLIPAPPLSLPRSTSADLPPPSPLFSSTPAAHRLANLHAVATPAVIGAVHAGALATPSAETRASLSPHPLELSEERPPKSHQSEAAEERPPQSETMTFPEFDETENGNSVTELLPKKPHKVLPSNFFTPPGH